MILLFRTNMFTKEIVKNKGEIKMLKNKRIIFVILMLFLMILIPSVVKAEKKDLSKIEINVPTPVVGETPALYDEASVVADGNIELETSGITWYIWDWDNQQYILMDATEKFNGLDKYAVDLGYKRSFDYNVLDENGYVIEELKMFFNGSEIDAHDLQVYNPESSGTAEYGIDGVWYEFGYANKAKYITTVDISVPVPELGKKQHGMEAFSVKIDENENLEVIGVEWEKYNSEKGEYETDSVIISDVIKSLIDDDDKEELAKLGPKDFEEGAKYRVCIIYRRPWKYGYSDDVIAKINGNLINVNDVDEFNIESAGERNYAWDAVIAEFSELKKYEPIPDKDKENDKNTNLGTETEKNKEESKKEETKKEDSTKAGGTIPYAGGEIVIILSAIAIIGLGIYLFRKNKDLKGI